MPYIKQEQRNRLATDGAFPNMSGELNYRITKEIFDYFKDHPNYQGINDIVGALESAKMEFYRRIVAHYEDQKIKENGDVY